jgi:O-antigen/teichoic acid export membrane protein
VTRILTVPGSTESQPPATGTSRRNLLLTFRSSAGAAAVSFGLSLAVLPFVLHRVGPELYGVWVTVAALLAVGGLADAGIRTEVMRRVAAAKGKDDDAQLVASVQQGMTLLACLGGVVFLLAIAATPLIRGFAFPAGVAGYGAAEIDLVIRATLALLLVTLVGNAYFAVLRGVQRGDVETLAQMVALPVGAAVTVVAVIADWSIWALFAGSTAQLLVLFGVEWAGVRRLVPALTPRLTRVTKGTARAYLALSGLALLSQISDVVDSQWDKLVISHFVGSGAVTSFQVGTSVVLQGKAIALLPLAPLLVAIAELRHREDDRLESLYRLLSKASFVLGAVILSATFVYAPAFLELWLGVPGAAAGGPARLFAVAATLNLMSAPFALRAFGEGWHSVAAVSALVNMVLNGVLSLVLTMALGLNGALYGSIIGTAAGVVVLLVLMRRKMGKRWIGPPLRALTIGAVAAAGVVLLRLDDPGSWAALGLAAAGFTSVIAVTSILAERLPVSALLRSAAGRVAP